MSVVVDLAGAVADSVNAQSFEPPIEAQRLHLPVFDLSKVGDAIQVSVVGRSVNIQPASRTSQHLDVAVDIGVQRRVDPSDQAQIDELLNLVEQIEDHLRGERLSTYPTAQWVSSQRDPVLAAEHLEQMNVFTAVLTTTYRITK